MVSGDTTALVRQIVAAHLDTIPFLEQDNCMRLPIG
jgi:hypothetical protein